MSTEKTAVFIDGLNLYNTVKSLGFDIDFKKLLTELGSNRIHDLAVINPRTLAALRQQRFEQRPFLVAQIKSHDPPPHTVNHVRPKYSNSYLGTDPSEF